MAFPNSQEQYMLELVNRARFNPQGEAKRYNISLNEGLNPGEISATPKQPLAFNLDLIDAARDHSQWMLNTNTFSHTGKGRSSAGDRMEDAGYEFTGSWTWGENIAWQGTTGTFDFTEYVGDHHENLFLSPGHRINILGDDFREIGIGSLIGEFREDGTNYNSVMTTQNFAKTGEFVFLTGVVFEDVVIEDDFYTVGEGLGNIKVKVVNQDTKEKITTITFDSGGYQIGLDSGTYKLVFSGKQLNDEIKGTVEIDDENVKVDLIIDDSGTPSLFSNQVSSEVLNKVVSNDKAKGTNANEEGIGGDDNDTLEGGNGDDTLKGRGGNDTLKGKKGNDTLHGGKGQDTLEGGDGKDTLLGQKGQDVLAGGKGKDTLTGGGGRDDFMFNSPGQGPDIITDFVADKDYIFVDANSFGADLIPLRFIAEEQFTIGSEATNNKHRFVYNDRNGKLFFDSDGKGEVEQVHFATLSNLAEISSQDIFLM